jgi:UV DNA damage repair endonuclease
MILSKTPHKLGCSLKIPSESSKLGFSCSELISFVEQTVSHNIKHGIDLTCLEINQHGSFTCDFSLLEEEDQNSKLLEDLSIKMREKSHRLFVFVSQYYFLGSQITEVVEETHNLITRLSYFLEILGQTGPSIIIRVGSAYGNRKETLQRFVREIKKVNLAARKMLVVTNDEKPSLFSVTDLLAGIYYECKLPICFRSLPHNFNSGGLTFREALFLSCSTWESSFKPVYIHSESSMIDDDGISKSPIPSDKLSYRIPIFGLDVDVLLDSNNSFATCIDYMAKSRILKPMVINKSTK